MRVEDVMHAAAAVGAIQDQIQSRAAKDFGGAAREDLGPSGEALFDAGEEGRSLFVGEGLGEAEPRGLETSPLRRARGVDAKGGVAVTACSGVDVAWEGQGVSFGSLDRGGGARRGDRGRRATREEDRGEEVGR